MRPYYHATPAGNVGEILREGLKPVRSGGGMSLARPGFKARSGIYLFGDSMIAEDWAALATEEGLEKGIAMPRRWVILEVLVPEGVRLFRDPDFADFFDARFLVDRVPPGNISVYGEITTG